MKKLNEEEFYDRLAALAKAKKIFMPHLTTNVTIAFEMYQELLAEGERAILLGHGDKTKKILDFYERPKCPDCGENLFLRLIYIPKGKSNRQGYKTCWECVEGPEDCVYEEYSGKTLNQWMRELERKPIEEGRE